MRFRRRIILSFSILVLVISLLCGVVYSVYSIRDLVDSEQRNMSMVSGQMRSNLTQILDSMKDANDYFLSDAERLAAMKVLPAYTILGDEMHREEALNELSSGLNIYFYPKNFYRVLYFTKQGDILASSNGSERLIDVNKDISEITWLSAVDKRKGKILLLGPHEDDWGIKNKETVISVARKVWGGDYGYIEVQQTVDSIMERLLQAVGNMEVMIVLENGELLYQAESLAGQSEVLQFAAEMAEKNEMEATAELKAGKVKKLVSLSRDPEYGYTIVVTRNYRDIVRNMNAIVFVAFLLILVCFAVCMAAVVLVADRVSVPIRRLREQMEHTELENLQENLALETSDDEVAALGRSYQKMKERLNDAIVKEKRMSLLQLQAQYDTLQAQMNPHFMYNTLNVISNRGILSGDEQICEICGSLAAMLRYSTNTKERYATIEEELKYLEQYVYLLKSRYEHKLEVEISCEDGIFGEILPKIVLQQLVENSIQHGYANRGSVMKLQVHGYAKENGWCFEVIDNGQGISDEVKQELETKLDAIRNRILMRRDNIEMEIGGMGLANTYARMYLMYQERTRMEFENLSDGVKVIVGVYG